MPLIARIPIVKWLWAWWRVREARLRNERLPPAIDQFELNELIPLKGFHFRVAYRGRHGIVLEPVQFTGAQAKRLATMLRRSYVREKASA